MSATAAVRRYWVSKVRSTYGPDYGVPVHIPDDVKAAMNAADPHFRFHGWATQAGNRETITVSYLPDQFFQDEETRTRFQTTGMLTGHEIDLGEVHVILRFKERPNVLGKLDDAIKSASLNEKLQRKWGYPDRTIYLPPVRTQSEYDKVDAWAQQMTDLSAKVQAVLDKPDLPVIRETLGEVFVEGGIDDGIARLVKSVLESKWGGGDWRFGRYSGDWRDGFDGYVSLDGKDAGWAHVRYDGKALEASLQPGQVIADIELLDVKIEAEPKAVQEIEWGASKDYYVVRGALRADQISRIKAILPDVYFTPESRGWILGIKNALVGRRR